MSQIVKLRIFNSSAKTSDPEKGAGYGKSMEKKIHLYELLVGGVTDKVFI